MSFLRTPPTGMDEGVRSCGWAPQAACWIALAVLSCCFADPQGEPPSAASEPIRILALGDSYTIGQSVPESERWPVQLAAALEARGLNIAPPRIIARTGWSTTQLQAAIDQAELDPPYDLVTLLIGVNDQVRSVEPATYPDRFRALLARAIELAGSRRDRVLVVSIPDYGVTPFGQRMDAARIASELDRYNAINREHAEAAEVRYVDITPISREALSDPALIAPDGLHPSGKMYARWVERVLPLAEEALGGDTRARP